MRRVAGLAVLVLLALDLGESPVLGQAWAPRPREGGVTLVAQMIDHIGRIDGDTRFKCCGTTNVALAVDIDYGLADRWSVSATLPYVFGKYRGGPYPDPLPYPAVDACHCIHSTFQDVQFAGHYNVLRVRRVMSVMSSVSAGIPTHDYAYAGESVVGYGLKQLGLGADAEGQLRFISRALSVGGSYEYTVVERVLGIAHNRSNARVRAGYAFTNGLGGHAILSTQQTHGGLRFPADVVPFPDRYSEFHRVLQDNYVQAGAGLSYAVRDWELSVSMLRTISGANTHDVHVYTLTAGRSFRW